MDEVVGTGFLVRSTKSRHAVLVAFLSFIFYILCHLNEDVDNCIIWWFMHGCLLGFFYFFLQPSVQFFSQPLTGKPSYIHFNKWLALWILAATAYHLPISRYVGVSMRMNPSLFLTTFVYSVLLLLVCHSIYEGLHCFVSSEAPKWPDIWTIFRPIWTILIVSAVVTVACCIHLRDYRERPLAKRHVMLASNWLHGGSPSEIFLVFELWAEVMAICIVCYIYAGICRLSTSRKKKQMKPAFLDMVPWYSGTSADLYKTVFNLVVSLKFFLGRFDGRILQATTNHFEDGPQQRDFLYTQLSKEEELWFDFIADTGDGGNSTYTIARLLAKPSICFPKSNLNLKRGNLLLIGGDIAYPNPSELTYEKRLFLPFEYALQTPPLHEEDHNSSQVMPYDGPKCFIIPGNHDWLDGLHTFSKYVCHKNWLGGWHMLQRKSYFALELPKTWWVFGLDLALLGDIDVYQFEFFKKLVEKKVGEKDSVIVMTHQPDWLLNWYENNGDSKNNVHSLINILKERCKLRIAGDIHHYMHHKIVKSDGSASSQPDKKPAYVQHLLVNGCGGAFTHPTHVFHEFSESHGVSYECKAEYPSFKTSRRLALGNIWNFRKENWQFDFVGGVIYFTLAISMFPQCELDHIFQVDTISDRWRSFSGTVWNAFIYMLEHSYVSLGSAMLLLTMAIAFVPRKVSWRTRIMMGILHVSAHVAAALCLRLVLELGVEMLVRHELLETSGYHSLYRRYQSIESRYFPVSNGTRARVEQWTFGLYPASIKYLLYAFDVPELMAVTRSNICKNGLESISRWGVIIYYASGLLYFWVLSTPFVSFVFGSYLYICMRWFDLHYDEGFSSLRIADYKAFTRFHIKPNGDLEVFTLAVDKVPEDWTLDSEFEKEQAEKNKLSHERAFPSKWRAAAPYKDPIDTVRIIDQFLIRQTEDNQKSQKNKTEDNQKHDIGSESGPTSEATGSSTTEEG